MHLNSFLDVHIAVFRTGLKTMEFFIQIIKLSPYLGTTSQILFNIAVHVPLAVKLTLYRVFVSLNKIGDHSPKQLHFGCWV